MGRACPAPRRPAPHTLRPWRRRTSRRDPDQPPLRPRAHHGRVRAGEFGLAYPRTPPAKPFRHGQSPGRAHRPHCSDGKRSSGRPCAPRGNRRSDRAPDGVEYSATVATWKSSTRKPRRSRCKGKYQAPWLPELWISSSRFNLSLLTHCRPDHLLRFERYMRPAQRLRPDATGG